MGLNLGIEKFLNSYRITYVKWRDDMKVEASVFSQIMTCSKVVTEELFISGDILAWHEVVVHFFKSMRIIFFTLLMIVILRLGNQK